MSFRSLLRCCVLFATSALAGAQTTIHVPADRPTIQAGIDAANTGDTVLVAPGTYTESIDFKGKAITVTSSGGAASTIIDGGTGQKQAAVAFRNKEGRNSVLSGFTLQNGGYEGNIDVFGTQPSAGIYVSGAAPTISHNVLTHNHCYGIWSDGGSPLIQENQIDHTLDANGGCTFAGGAAIWLDGSLISYNSANPYMPATVLGNLIQDNTDSGREDAGGNGGVGVAVWGGHALIEGNTIRNNRTLGEGAIYAFNTDDVSVIANLIYANTASGTTAGIGLFPPGETVGPFIGIIANNTVADNVLISTSPNFGVAAAEVWLEGNLAQYVLVNNVIVTTQADVAAVACGEGYNYLSYTPLVFDHNDVYSAPGAGPAYTGACPDQTGTYGNISADPRFVDQVGGDFHLQPGSPAIDTGNNSAPDLLPTDITGAPRIQDATGLGHPVVDMGVYEAPGKSSSPVTTLTLTPSTYFDFLTPSTSGSPFTLTAKLGAGTQTPTGPVTFYEDLNAIGTVAVDASGTATLQPKVAPGLHAFLATYPGQGPFSPAVSVKFYVLFPKATPSLTLTSSSNPSVLGTAVTFTLTASSSDGTIPTPISLVDASSNTPLATLSPDASGKATFTTSTLALGAHTITASFAGSATDNAVSASLTQVVTSAPATSTTLTSSPNPSTYLQNVTFSAHVASLTSSGTPAGTIAFLDGTNTLASVPLDTAGNASYTTAALVAAPQHLITAQFNPTGNFAPSSAQITQVVNGLRTATSLSVTPLSGLSTDTYTMVATVANASGTPVNALPSGTVNFFFSGYGASAASYANLVNGVATFQATNLTPGQNVISATYNGDTIFAASSSTQVPVTVTGAPTTLTLTSSANPALAANPFVLTVHLTANGVPAPTGELVQLTLGSGQSATLTTDATGSASYTATIPLPGTYPVSASFPGKNGLLPSAGTLTETVNGLPTSVTLAAIPNPAFQGQTLTLSGTVSASALPVTTGTLTFYDGTALLGTAPLSAAGQATLTTSSLSVGAHTLTAAFPATGALLSSTSPVLQVNILPSTFAVTLSPATITLHAGQTGTVAVALGSIGSFAGPLTLGAGPWPSYATGSFTPGTVTLAAAGSAAATLSLSTAQEAANRGPAPPGSRSWPLVVMAGLALPFGLSRSRRLRQSLALLAIALLCQILTGCGTLGVPFHLVPAGTYLVPITATDANQNQKSAMLTVIITP